ncbi:HIT domain-containing protein [Candidatus Micrarchaeota archaeon]|nr:HIT domain-containing protein [Candidatus Micrarchaeota archaeon]
MTCLFCDLAQNKDAFLYENSFFYCVPDKFPASPGHALIILKTHKESFFELAPEELDGAMDALKETKKILDGKHRPDAYNIAVNEGAAAGRMIPHMHIHLIPRYASAEKRGGVEVLLKSK